MSCSSFEILDFWAAGAPSLSSSWDDGASQTTWFEEHLSRPPELELAPLATAEAFQEAKRTYSRKLEIWERLHRLRRKFDRCVTPQTSVRF